MMLQQVDKVVARAHEMWDSNFEVQVDRAGDEVLVVCSRHAKAKEKVNVVECLRWDSRDSDEDEVYHYFKTTAGGEKSGVVSFTSSEIRGEWIEL